MLFRSALPGTPDLAPSAYRLTLMGVILAEAEIYPDREMAINPGQVFGSLNGITAKDPAFGLDAVWIEISQRSQAQSLGYTVVDASTVVATHLNQILYKHSHELIGHEEVQQLMGLLGKASPKLAEELVPGILSLSQLLKVLQALLAEQVPVRDIRSIAEAIANNAAKSQDTAALVAAVRVGLSRAIVQSIVGLDSELPVITLEPRLEQILLNSIQKAGQGQEEGVLLEPSMAEKLQRSLIDAAQRQEMQGQPVILLVAGPVRAMLSRFGRLAVEHLMQHGLSIAAEFKLLAAGMEVQITLNISPALQSTGLVAETDLLVGEQAQVGQYQIRPALAEIAKKHQPQAITQGSVVEGIERLGKAGMPLGQALPLDIVNSQLLKPVRFLAFGLRNAGAETGQNFRFLQYIKHLDQSQRRLIIQPANGQQGCRCQCGITDFRVIEPVGPEVLALAHDHAYPKRLRGAGQLGKSCDKPLLVDTQHVLITRGDPVKHMPEIFQVVKRVFEGVGNHGQS